MPRLPLAGLLIALACNATANDLQQVLPANTAADIRQQLQGNRHAHFAVVDYARHSSQPRLMLFERNSLRLLALPEPVQEMLYARRLEMGHARALLTLPVVTQLELAQKAVKNGWSVREVERRSQMAQQGKPAEAPKRDNPDIRRLSEALTETLGVNAEVHSSNQKKGRIVLHFDSPETLEALLKQLGVDLPN